MYNVSNHVIAQIMKLDEEKKNQFNAYYLGKQKETGTAWILFLLLGAFYGYTDQWGKQILFWITLGGCGLWALILLFNVSSGILAYNDKKAMECMMMLQ